MIRILLLLNPSAFVAILLAGIFGGIAGAYGYEVALWARGFALRLPAHMRRLKMAVAPFRYRLADSVNVFVCFGGFGFCVLVLGMVVVEFDAPYWAGPVVGLMGTAWIGGVAFMGSGVWSLVPGPFELVDAEDVSEDDFVVVVRRVPTVDVLECQVAAGPSEVVCC